MNPLLIAPDVKQTSSPRYVGNWQLLQELGTGAYGSVYEATHRTIADKRAAIKILHQKISSNLIARNRFLKEASAASLAHHENIVKVFDSGINEEGYCYIIMELILGSTLNEILRKEALSAQRVINLGIEVAKALSAAHKNSITHRDIKPDNIFIIQNSSGLDKVKLVDFGVAKFHDALGDAMSTRTGTWVGTRAYMAPEQWKTPTDIDHRVDIYALGVVLYESLTGRLPFSASNDYEWLLAHTEQPVPDPGQHASAPGNLCLLIQRLLAKERDQRPATMQDVADQLEQCIDTQSASGRSSAAKNSCSHSSAVINASSLSKPRRYFWSGYLLKILFVNKAKYTSIYRNFRFWAIVGFILIALIFWALIGIRQYTDTVRSPWLPG